MLEIFKTVFAASWGLIAAVLSFAVIVGLVDALTGAAKMARMRQRIKMRLRD